MRLSLRNVGLIEQEEFDLRPLTVLVGPNNTNKSWTAYAAWAAAGAFAGSPDRFAISEGPPEAHWEPPQPLPERMEIRRSEVELLSGASATVVLQSVLGGRLETDGAAGLGLSTAELAAGYASRAELWPSSARSWWFDLFTESDRRIGRFHFESDAPRSPDTVVESLIQRYFNRLVPFPIERLHSSFPRSRSYTPFVSDFADLYEEALHSPDGGQIDIAERIERVLGGRVVADGASVGFQTGGLHLDLGISSSMIRTLAPVVLYLRRLAQPWDWVFIDEPEMNAHPRAQLAIAEMLALMINRGIHVLITTHSPYVVDHLSNLMAASRLSEPLQRKIAGRFELGTSEAFLDPEKVSAYLFEPRDERVIVKDILDRETATVDISTFSEQSDRLGALFGAVLDLDDHRQTG